MGDHGRAAAVLAVLTVVGAAGSAAAQTAGKQPPVRRVSVAVAGGLMGGASLGQTDAALRARGGGDYPLFTTDSRVSRAAALEVKASFALTRRYAAEGRIRFSRPELRTSISGDVEGAPPLEVAERLDQYTFEGALVVTLDRFRWRGLVPFASAGAGYLRQLHEGRTLVEHGAIYHAGGGVKHWLVVRERGFVRAVGVRGDARLSLISGGIGFDEGPRPHVGMSGGAFVTF